MCKEMRSKFMKKRNELVTRQDILLELYKHTNDSDKLREYSRELVDISKELTVLRNLLAI